MLNPTAAHGFHFWNPHKDTLEQMFKALVVWQLSGAFPDLLRLLLDGLEYLLAMHAHAELMARMIDLYFSPVRLYCGAAAPGKGGDPGVLFLCLLTLVVVRQVRRRGHV